MPKRIELAAALRKAINDRGLSQYRISQDTGISQSALSRFMAGIGVPSLDTAEVLMGYLGFKIQPPPKPAKRSTR